MKMKIIYAVALTVCSAFIACKGDKTNNGSEKYTDYTEVYNKDGYVVLKSNSRRTDSSIDGTHKVFTHPEDGRIFKDSGEAATCIRRFQNALSTKDKTTRYVDFYFARISEYSKLIADHIKDTTGLGIRLYYAINESGKNTIVAGPIKNVDTKDYKKVDVLWMLYPKEFSAFDFGGLCPELCSNNDTTGLVSDTHP